MAKKRGNSSNSSSFEDALKALGQTIETISNEGNARAAEDLTNKLNALAAAMKVDSIPALISNLEKLGTISREQADALRNLYPAAERLNYQLEELDYSMRIDSLPLLIAQFEKFSAIVERLGASMQQALPAGSGGGALAKNKPIVVQYLRPLPDEKAGGVTGGLGGGSSFGGIAKGIVAVAETIYRAGKALIDFGIQIQRLVAKANPAAAFKFNRALDDLNATFGQILTPVLEGITGYIRELADVLQGMRPALEPIAKSIGSIIVELAGLIEPLAQLLLPFIRLLAGEFQVTAIYIKAMVDQMLYFRRAIDLTIQALTFGMAQLDEFKKGSSYGAAIQHASYGNIGDIGKRTTLAALNTGRDATTADGKAITGKQSETNALLKRLIKVSSRTATFGLSDLLE